MSSSISFTQNGGASYTGAEAVDVFRIKCVVQGLKAAKIGMMLTRGATPAKMLAMASSYTGIKYKRGAYDLAIADLIELAIPREQALMK